MRNCSSPGNLHQSADHTPALKEEVLGALLVNSPSIVVDSTAGSGGHTDALAERMDAGRVLLAVDIDPQSVARLNDRFKNHRVVRVIHGNYANLHDILRREGLRRSDAVLLDLGFSSVQLASPGRGFSFLHDERLDMRFDQTEDRLAAAQVLRSHSEKQLAEVFWKYGEEPRARKIARALAAVRKRAPILRTVQLADLIAKTTGGRGKQRLHPATRVFQALRIYVNKEFDNLTAFIDSIPVCVNKGGRVCIISYHSLEDRIVKMGFRRMAENGSAEIVTPKPIRPTAREVASNPRARGAKMRVAVVL
jgi:16S rRNA (cytosine1402-N4)-methyltransferase